MVNSFNHSLITNNYSLNVRARSDKMAEPKFEEALKKLERIVDDLGSGELNLDDAINRYEEGMKLSKFCYKKLQDIQKKVEVLVKDSSGKITARDFNTTGLGVEEDSSASEGQKQKTISKRKRPKGEELLF